MTIPTQGEDLVLVPREASGPMWSAGRRAFALAADKYRSAGTAEEASIAADTAPDEIYRAMISASPSREEGGPSCADSGGSQPQEAVKSDGPRGLGGEG